MRLRPLANAETLVTPPDRREFLRLTAGGVGDLLLAPAPVAAAAFGTRVKAVVFDAFPIFDPRPVFALAEQAFPGRGTELSNLWRTRQFEYTWLRTIAGHYAEFWQVTEDALVFASGGRSRPVSG